MEQSQASMGAILAEYRASDACTGPLRHVRLESAHHVEETTGGREHGLWLYNYVEGYLDQQVKLETQQVSDR